RVRRPNGRPKRLREPAMRRRTIGDILRSGADSRRTGIKPTAREDRSMRIVVIGGTGLVGSKLVTKLRTHGHDAISAALPNVNTLTGEALAAALSGVDTVVDVSNSPSFEDAAALNFFKTSTANLLAAEAAEGVHHHVALSVVGTERLLDSGYFRAKMAQEELIRSGPIPYSIVHATQFFEFVKSIADAATTGNVVKLSPALIQPMAANDVAGEVLNVSVAAPLNGLVEIGGPEQFPLDGLVRQGLA